jgi:hypothetical protein
MPRLTLPHNSGFAISFRSFNTFILCLSLHLPVLHFFMFSLAPRIRHAIVLQCPRSPTKLTSDGSYGKTTGAARTIAVSAQGLSQVFSRREVHVQ